MQLDNRRDCSVGLNLCRQLFQQKRVGGVGCLYVRRSSSAREENVYRRSRSGLLFLEPISNPLFRLFSSKRCIVARPTYILARRRGRRRAKERAEEIKQRWYSGGGCLQAPKHDPVLSGVAAGYRRDCCCCWDSAARDSRGETPCESEREDAATCWRNNVLTFPPFCSASAFFFAAHLFLSFS